MDIYLVINSERHVVDNNTLPEEKGAVKRSILIFFLVVTCALCLCGCTKTCSNCGNDIEQDSEIVVEKEIYCKECVEYCSACKATFVKDSDSLLIYEEKPYCKDCFEKVAYPIMIEDNDKFSAEIINYDDNDGFFAVSITNKTEYSMSIFQEGESVLVDGKDRCIAETDGSCSFAYIDVPAQETVTVFSSFREDMDEGWDTILKMSQKHTFELVMTAWIDDGNFDGFWDTQFKVTLTPDMFGYTV